MEKANIIDTIKDNALSFVLGWVVGQGLWPVLWDQLTNLWFSQCRHTNVQRGRDNNLWIWL